MLKLLRVKNLALMEDITIDFERGLTVVTGETGAGKSMIVEAIATLCGNRLENIQIRSGRDFAEVTGVFDIGSSVMQRLREAGIEAGADIIIRRRIEHGKRQTAYINDQLVSLNLLNDVAQDMIDLIGQHENQSLFHAKNHLSLLDSFAGLDSSKGTYNKQYNAYRRLTTELAQLHEAAKQKDEMMDYIKYQIREIQNVNPQPGEEDGLVEEKNLLVTSEKRSLLSTDIITNLYEADGSVIDHAAKIRKLVEELAACDSKVEALNERMASVISILDDIYRDISSYHSSIEFSQPRLDYVLERLEALQKIKKKYGATAEAVRNHLASLKKQLSQIELYDDEIKKFEEHSASLEKKLANDAEELSQQRRRAAATLTKRILHLVSQLGMKKADFEVRFTPHEIGENGKDNVEFYISTNPGEELKPLRKIASGGEISRITLSLKTILSEVDRIPTIVFDEVDLGIGGRIAEAVGDLLSKISKHHQIICITHLPQISVYGDNHILVTKEVKDKETFTRIIKLDEETRKLEIARMLGGKEITKKTVEYATEYLRKVQQK